MKTTAWRVVLAGVWITVSEFGRNELLLKSYWIDYFDSLGLVFETLPLNGLLWTVWSFALAYLIHRLLKRFSFWEAVFLGWLAAFVMMWITLFNLQVLPLTLLAFAVPLSLLEVSVAAVILVWGRRSPPEG